MQSIALNKLLRQLVTLARADEQNIAQPVVENVDLNEIAFNVLSERAPQAFARDIDVQFDRFDGPAIIPGNSVLIGELLANLIDNAIRYNRAGGMVLVRVIVDATTRESKSRIPVLEFRRPIWPASSSAFIGFR